VEPVSGNQADFLYNPFPEPLSSNNASLTAIDLPHNFSSSGNRQQQFGTIQQPTPMSHFGFEDSLAASVEDINSCWQNLGWQRS